jgi:uncharacterized membrane protein
MRATFVTLQSAERISHMKRYIMSRFFICLGFLTGCMFAAVTPAAADLKLCNNTSSRVGVAIGYKDQDIWVSEGWWNVASHTCEVLLKGTLVARYYYVHALDYDRGGEWGGSAFMCTGDKAFTIRGEKDCQKRGFKRSGFFEVDTNQEKDWVVKLTDPGEGGAATQ